ILKPYGDIIVIKDSRKKENTILKIRRLKPAVILLDLGLRSQNSLLLVKKIKKEFPDPGIIIMDLVPFNADINRFVKAGASGFVLKNATVEEFISTIRAVAAGVKYIPKNSRDFLLTQIVEYGIKSGKTGLMRAMKLTKREKEVLILISEGNVTKAIAQKLGISEETVKSQKDNIVEKLALRKQLDPVVFRQDKIPLKN
ncbi:MAG: response regulator transcription factor, partial [Ignavibacteria bacterium]|nr:response regulator transcription factor [Ignavibacteria bacterium]